MIKWSEVVCKCGKCGRNLTTKFFNTVNDIREDFGKPNNVVGGARCPEHNAKVGGAKASAHMEGCAVDIKRTPALLAFSSEENLEKYNIFMEDPEFTKTWLHWSDRPYASWKQGMTRVFKP